MGMTRSEAMSPQRPAVLLTGFFIGFASVCLTMGVFWPFAPLFPAVVAGIAAVVPVDGHLHFAKGAIIAAMGVVVFLVVVVVLMFVGAGLH